jgi:flagella basal body P-ring formation protein FlgA
MTGLAGWVMAACVAVPAGSDKITAGDLAAVEDAFGAIEGTQFVGWAPAPGMRRTFSPSELIRLAARLGARVAPERPVCVERRTAPLDAAGLRAALQAQLPEGTIQLLDFSRAPVPEGDLVFPRSGLRRRAGASYWNGYIRYAGKRRFSVWAKVAVAVPVVVAAADLDPGRAIEAAQLRIEERDDLAAAGSLEKVTGKWPRRPIRAGTPVLSQWLAPAPEIARGDAVTVEVQIGAAYLKLDGRAEAAAALGQPIAVRNPATQKRFVARVEGRGRVSVGAPGHEEKP